MARTISDLKGWWKGESNVEDSSGFGNNGIVQDITYAAGKVGNAMIFNGSTSDIDLDGNFSSLAAEFTIAFWFKPGNLNGDVQELFYRPMGSSGGARSGTLKIHSDNRLRFFIRTADVTDYNMYSSSTLVENTWYHAVATFKQNGTMALYLNGVLQDSETEANNQPSITDGNDSHLGSKNDSDNWFTGSLDDVRIYGRQLNAKEIAAIYNKGNGNDTNNYTRIYQVGAADYSRCFSPQIDKIDGSGADLLTMQVLPRADLQEGDEIKFYDKDSTYLFGGFVQKIKKLASLDVKCINYQQILLGKKVSGVFEGYSPEGLFQHLIETYTTLTFSTTITSGLTLPIRKYQDKKLIDILKLLAGYIGADFEVDKNKVITLARVGDSTSSITLTDQNFSTDGFVADVESVVNFLTVVGNVQKYTKEFYLSGDGSTTQFTLDKKPDAIEVEYPIGTPLEGYIDGSTTGDYNVTRANQKINFDSAPASGSQNILTRITWNVPIRFDFTDQGSIDAYGERERKDEQPTLNTYDECFEYASQVFAIEAQPAQSAKGTYNDVRDFEQFTPNHRIYVDSDQYGQNRFYVIKRVKWTPGRIELTIGDNDDKVVDWMKESTLRIKQLEEKDDDNDEIRTGAAISFNTQVRSTFSIDEQLKRTLPDEYIYFAPEITNLVAWYPLDGHVRDISGNNNHGTFNGTVAYGTGKQFAQAAQFDDANTTYIDCGATFVPAAGEGYSICAWVKTNDTSDNLQVIASCIEGGFNNGWALYLSGDKIQLKVDDQSNNDTSENTESGTITQDTWHHVIGIIDQANLQIQVYIDGAHAGTTALPGGWGSMSTTEEMDIGRYRPNSSYDMDGEIADVRIYNKVLSSAEIAYLYNSGNGVQDNTQMFNVGSGNPREIGTDVGTLYAHYPLDGDALDISGNANHGTELTAANFVVGKQFDTALDMDGSSDDGVETPWSPSEITNDKFTIACWVRPANLDSSGSRSIAYGQDDGGSNRFYLDTPNDGTDSIRLGLSDWNPKVTDELVVDTWYHVVVVLDGTTGYFYGNGVQIATTTGISTVLTQTDRLNIGINDGQNSGRWEGQIADFRIYNDVALTAEEVEGLYNGGAGIKDNTINLDAHGNARSQIYEMPSCNYWGLPTEELPNLLMHLKFEDNITDSSSNAYTLTEASGAVTYETGKVGSKAGTFDGSTHLEITSDDFRTSEATWMCWFKPNNLNDIYMISYDNGTSSRFLLGLKGSTDQLRIHDDIADEGDDIPAGPVLSIGTWYHATVTIASDGTKKLYLNGDLIHYDQTGSNLSAITAGATLSIGSQQSGSNRWNGALDDVRIFSRVLSTEEIQAIYNSGTGRSREFASWEDIT